MRRWLALAFLLLALVAPGHAQDADDADPGEKRERLEVYYNRSFFGEPWRQDGADKTVEKEAVEVSIAAGVVLGVLRKLRRSG